MICSARIRNRPDFKLQKSSHGRWDSRNNLLWCTQFDSFLHLPLVSCCCYHAADLFGSNASWSKSLRHKAAVLSINELKRNLTLLFSPSLNGLLAFIADILSKHMIRTYAQKCPHSVSMNSYRIIGCFGFPQHAPFITRNWMLLRRYFVTHRATSVFG